MLANPSGVDVPTPIVPHEMLNEVIVVDVAERPLKALCALYTHDTGNLPSMPFIVAMNDDTAFGLGTKRYVIAEQSPSEKMLPLEHW